MKLFNAILSQIERNALRIAARRRHDSKLIILTYHRVLPKPDPLIPDEPDASLFEFQMRFIARHFNVLPLTDAAELLASDKLPVQTACITFDDGYANNYHVALPILQRLEIPATVFVTTGLLGNGSMFNDTIIESIRVCPELQLDLSSLNLGILDLGDDTRRAAAVQSIIHQLKYDPHKVRSEKAQRIAELAGLDGSSRIMMTDGEVQKLHAAGIEIGAHTVNHPILTNLSAQQAQDEINSSFAYLRDLTGEPPHAFAYPNGQPGRDYDSSHVDMVRRTGFKCAVSTEARYASKHDNPFELPRVTIWSGTSARLTVNLARIYLNG